MMKFKIIITLVMLLSAASCRQESVKTVQQKGPAGQQQAERPGRTKINIGSHILWVEIADRPDTRERGLMFRKSMPGDEGMLFIFEYPQIQSFWMRNTYIPLDIAFISDNGRIINILSMKPLDEGPRYRSLAPALYVIETNAGWFEANGIKTGDQVKF